MISDPIEDGCVIVQTGDILDVAFNFPAFVQLSIDIKDTKPIDDFTLTIPLPSEITDGRDPWEHYYIDMMDANLPLISFRHQGQEIPEPESGLPWIYGIYPPYIADHSFSQDRDPAEIKICVDIKRINISEWVVGDLFSLVIGNFGGFRFRYRQSNVR